jgi:DNA-binding HxlR family transcriptional regulator
MTENRTYGDPCGIARALDLVGERWALLLVRELLLGPKRFTDLREGLPGASPNVLAQRLRDLEAAGVLQRRRLGPPASVQVYELTGWGRDLEPVLLALGRWGRRSPARPTGALGVDALLVALKTTFDPATAPRGTRRYQLRIGDDRFHVRVADGALDVTRGSGNEAADAVIETDAATLREVAFGRRSLAQALRAGQLTITGDRRAAEELFRLFPTPGGGQ